MSYAFTQDVPIDEDLYRKITDQLGPDPMAGSCCTCAYGDRTAASTTSTCGRTKAAVSGRSTSASTPPWTRRSAAADLPPNR